MKLERVYVRFRGKTLGPLPPQKVRDLVRRGQITRLHELSGDGFKWHRAEEFAEFFQPVAAREPEVTVAAEKRPPSDQTLEGTAPPLSSDPGRPSPDGSRPRHGESPEESVQWYVHVNGESLGPLTSPQVALRIQSGELTEDTLVWRAGFDDWRSAGENFPTQFAQNSRPDSYARSSDSDRTASFRGGLRATDLADQWASHRTWTLFLGVSGLVFAGLFAVYFVTVMILGADRNLAPFQGSAKVVYGLLGLAFCGVLTGAAVLLLRYAVALKLRSLASGATKPQLAVRRLTTFWRYVGVCLLTFEVMLIGGLILILVLSFAAVDARS